jgi:hypothetical protein
MWGLKISSTDSLLEWEAICRGKEMCRNPAAAVIDFL